MTFMGSSRDPPDLKIVNPGRICKFPHYVPICHSYSLGNKSLIVKINMSFFSLFDDVPYSQILQRCFLYLKTYNFLQDHNLRVNISVSGCFSSECLMEKRSNCYGCISPLSLVQFIPLFCFSVTEGYEIINDKLLWLPYSWIGSYAQSYNNCVEFWPAFPYIPQTKEGKIKIF